ncbi:Alpha/Beta hydrolase protein [Mariannaea sp. PMI_226]|nr:Alpha/Beta hydrolase protein [Mariannaea sp. PMI_226]
MIFGPISLIDCFVFLILLLPQLLWKVGIIQTISVAAKALPFLLFKLPFEFIQGRYFTHPARQTGFVQSSTVFEDLVVRCVQYAFKAIPSQVSRVFFSKNVSLPFFYWRTLRHGHMRFQTHWREYSIGEGNIKTTGIWIMHEPEKPPSFVIYYVHGGGFCMGSSYFYLEFLTVLHHLLIEAGYANPAIFALDYTLVPDDVYPRQVLETLEGYKHVLEIAKDASKVCVAGDSAGGALLLSLLLELGAQTKKESSNIANRSQVSNSRPRLPMPHTAALISPWVTLMSSLHRPSKSDYLDRQTLWRFAHIYAGELMIQQQPASPGNCVDDRLWKATSPQRGYYIIFGEEEVFAPDIEDFVRRQARIGVEIEGQKFDGGIHAWPVASLFLSSTKDKRLQGLRAIVNEIRRRTVQVNGLKKGET